MRFYVYLHRDPRDSVIKYVGVGKYDRAWCVRSNQRKNKHVAWLKELFNLGYTLNDIVVIERNMLSKDEALMIEKQIILELKPLFNAMSNPNYWSKNRKTTPDVCDLAKSLQEMGYGYIRISHLVGGTKTNAMTIKRMISYVH